MPVTNLRPMLPAERELLLAITATCWAINEQTNHAAEANLSGQTSRLYIYVYHHKDDITGYSYTDHSVSFTELWPNNVDLLTRILQELTEFLPVHTMTEVLNQITA